MNDISDLFCFSHLRWGFIYQRPNHLMSRFSCRRRTVFFEEPVFDAAEPVLEVREVTPTLHVAVPHLAPGVAPEVATAQQQRMLESLAHGRGVTRPAAWFYTPMMLPIASVLRPCVTVYDCMDELSLFKGAPAAMAQMEAELLARADVVFTGGASLYEQKRAAHRSVHAFPSSVDVPHFERASGRLEEPADQAGLRRPRVGYFGAIDERIDLGLVDRLANELADWEIVMIGPVVKIDPATLPERPNIHYLGLKSYESLPAYLSGWDVAMMPFALNDATRFISPTKTLEYLAGGKPVVSTAIRDVVHPYGQRGLVTIANAETFPAAVRAARAGIPKDRREEVSRVLSDTSWDAVAGRMWALVQHATRQREVRAREGAASCSIT